VKNLYIVSLGCPKNLVDTESIFFEFKKKGFNIVSDEKDADFVLINTCSFLKSAIKESDDFIKHYIKLKKKGNIKKIFVAGCLVERFRDEVSLLYPEVDGFIGVGNYNEVSKLIDGRKKFIYGKKDFLEFSSRVILTKPHSVYLKIADGCNNRCSYCTIPMIRGNFRSKEINDVIKEAKLLARNGAKEISLIAQDTTSYGVDLYGKKTLLKLLKKLEKIKDVRWIRLLYLYPSKIDLDLLKYISESEKIAHYIEIPFQHISDKILSLMNRKYNSKDVYKTIEMIKKYIPDVSLRTSFIIGFPSETDDDFKKLISFINDVKFNYISFFKYSREDRTPSFNMKGVSKKIIDERYNIAIDIYSRVVDEINKEIEGKVYEIIFDDERSGRSYMDAPDIDGRFFVSNYVAKEGEFRSVKVLKTKGNIREGIVL
jgi:ribosomal protein S12 methylthiotransferase